MDIVCHGGEGIQEETLSIMVGRYAEMDTTCHGGKVYRVRYCPPQWGQYTEDIIYHGVESIQGGMQFIMVRKVYRLGQETSVLITYTVKKEVGTRPKAHTNEPLPLVRLYLPMLHSLPR